MCEAGRIRHHLKHNLWRSDSTVLFVGYQVPGTLGYALLNGAKKGKLFGEEIEVRASIVNLPGISGHADKNQLTEWLGAIKNKPEHVFIVRYILMKYICSLNRKRAINVNLKIRMLRQQISQYAFTRAMGKAYRAWTTMVAPQRIFLFIW